MNSDEAPAIASRWYHSWWGVALAGAGGLSAVALVAFAILTGWYWWKISHGQGVAFQAELYDGFTSVLKNAPAGATAAPRRQLENPESPWLGSPAARVTLVEFVDFKCPNCLAAAPIVRSLVGEYAQKIKIIARHFPAESIHPGATRLAELAYCSGQQGRFWPMSDALFANQDNISAAPTDAELQALANQLNLDSAKIMACVNSPQANQAVQADYLDGIKFGVRGTPTWFVNGVKVEGVVPLNVWEKYFDAIK